MKHGFLRLLLYMAPAAALAACGSTSAPTPIPTIVLVAGPAASSNSVSASGEIVPSSRAQLSFPLTGVVKTVQVQAGDPVSAGQVLATLDTSILQAKVAEADADLHAAQIHYTYLARTGTDQEHLDSSLADVARFQAALDESNAILGQADITAPFSGTIASVDIVPSETVVPGQVVIMLGDLTHFRVETTDLSERDAPKVSVGQGVQVSVPALNRDFPGKVSDISRISSTVGGDVVFKVTIELDTQPAGLLWGMTTNVQIAVGQ